MRICATQLAKVTRTSTQVAICGSQHVNRINYSLQSLSLAKTSLLRFIE